MKQDRARRLSPYFDPLAPAESDLYVARKDPLLPALLEARVSARQRQCLLIGAHGSGKSTELAHLARQLATASDPPVIGLIRLQDQCRPEALSAAQVLFLVGVAALRLAPRPAPRSREKALADAYDEVIEPSRGNGLKVDLKDLLKRLFVTAGGLVSPAELGLKALIGAGSALAGSFSVPMLPLPGKPLHLAANVPTVTRLTDAVNECIEWTRKEYSGAPIALFIDGLDWLAYEDIDRVFGTGIMALPTCTVVYTAPLALRHTVKGQLLEHHFDYLTIGNFDIFDQEPDGARNQEGFSRMRKILAQRIEKAGLSPEQVLEGALERGGLADRLIEASGGITRFLIMLFDVVIRRGCVGPGAHRELIGAYEIDSAIEDLEQRTVLRLEPRYVEPVLECWRSQRRPEGPAGDEMLFHNLIIYYSGTWPWYRPTPLLLRYLRDKYPDRCKTGVAR